MGLMYCARCGGAVSDNAIFCAQCGYSVARREPPLRYASFWVRVAAVLIDLALILPVALPLWITFGRATSDEERAVLAARMAGQPVPDSEFLRVEGQSLLKMFELSLVVFFVGWPYFTIMESSGTQ